MSFGPLAEPDYSHRVAKKVEAEILSIAGQDVKIFRPSFVFRRQGSPSSSSFTTILAVGEGALRGIRDRPIVLKRYVHGAEGEFFFKNVLPRSGPIG